MEYKNRFGISVKIAGFKLSKDKEYYENEIINFIEMYLNDKISSIEITKNNIKIFKKDAGGGYSNFIFHTTFNSKDEILTFISTLVVAEVYQNRNIEQK